MPTEFYFEIQYFNFDWKIAVTHLRESGFYEFKKITTHTQISVIQSQNQQQPVFPIQQLFQRSSQPEYSPV